MYILEVLGPIAIGIAMIPGFENSFNNWVSKYINVNLYTFITYTIINIGQQLIMSAYTMQINRLDTLAPSGTFDDPAVLQFVVLCAIRVGSITDGGHRVFSWALSTLSVC